MLTSLVWQGCDTYTDPDTSSTIKASLKGKINLFNVAIVYRSAIRRELTSAYNSSTVRASKLDKLWMQQMMMLNNTKQQPHKGLGDNATRKLTLLSVAGVAFEARACDRKLCLASPSKQHFYPWQRVLSSIATSEGMEGHVLAPLLQAYAGQPVIQAYLSRHAADEKKHHTLLCAYLKRNFQYVKEQATLADRIFYRGLLHTLQHRLVHNPVLGLAILYTYELFAAVLYAHLRRQAQAWSLHELSELVRYIESDEAVHIQGLRLVIKSHLAAAPLTRMQRQGIYLWLRLIACDVHMGRWAVHNRELRRSFASIGVEPSSLVTALHQAVHSTHSLLAVRG